MSKFFALIPAAGSGSRMENKLPKQYLSLAGRPMIYHAVRTLCLSSEITSVFVVLDSEDSEWLKYDWSEFSSKLNVFNCGGETRAMSILNGLKTASEASFIGDDDWVLVHDAARPCLSEELLKKLLNELADDAVGGLLAVPLSDTLKRSGANDRVKKTESRKDLWQAQTPQMFRYKLLMDALCKPDSITMTDDASAVEALGLYPKLVLGDVRNIKITYPQDLTLAELILQAQQGENYDK
ncbi:MAG: 2-C-methyl-D-erythritol 4-phosphate cytidylyltransferase [Nitrosomonadaceae bacterium]